MSTTQLPTLPDVLLVTGTDTGVGKTVVTAALATLLYQKTTTKPVAVHKLVQAGTESFESGDAAAVATLTWSVGDIPCTDGVRLLAPMAPKAAARLEDRSLPDIAEHVHELCRLATSHRVVAEGSGGLLVHLDDQGHTFADLPGLLSRSTLAPSVGVIVVCRSGLGTLNHTALTVAALAQRGIPVLGLVIGSWPTQPDVIDRTNVSELAEIAPILGAIPESAGQLTAERFTRKAADWLPGLQ